VRGTLNVEFHFENNRGEARTARGDFGGRAMRGGELKIRIDRESEFAIGTDKIMAVVSIEQARSEMI